MPAVLAPSNTLRRVPAVLAPSNTLRRVPAVLVLWLAACAATPDAPPPPVGAPAAPDAVRVRLAFGAEVDLDLYVTGPSQETVYFANDSSRDGGALDADRRCDPDAPPTRTETVVFPEAPAGRYRVGVDFQHRCDDDVKRAPYLLVVERPGGDVHEQRGEAVFGIFDPRVVEFRVEPE